MRDIEAEDVWDGTRDCSILLPKGENEEEDEDEGEEKEEGKDGNASRSCIDTDKE